MKKTRTIEIRNGSIYYRGIKKGHLLISLRRYFGIPCNGKVRITIKEKGPYKFKRDHSTATYDIYKASEYVSLVCCKEFKQFFFRPDERKSYDIIVERLT